MKILHTGDWHLGDRLNHIDRTEDLRRAVERVARYCDEHDVDVLLVAGDLFSERSRSDNLRDSVGHLHETFRPFLNRGGTIVALTGNHDNETFCRTLVHAMNLAAPTSICPGSLVPNGRFYLAAEPTFYRLRDRDGHEVQFVLMPYPTEHRYLAEEDQQYNNLEEKHRALQSAYTRTLADIRRHPDFQPGLPSVLSAHVHVKGSRLASLFRITEQDDILFDAQELADGWAYVALGHIHHAQHLPGLPHVRYCGSIERLDLGELRDDKSVVVVEVGPDGVRGKPEILPLEATPFLDIVIANPKDELPRLRETYPQGTTALARCQIDYQAGDDLNAVQREIRSLFPRCYFLGWNDRRIDGAPPDEATEHESMRDAVMSYLNAQLAEHTEREAVVQLAEKLLLEESR